MYTEEYTYQFAQVLIDKILEGIATDFGMDYETLTLSAQQSLNELSVELWNKGKEDKGSHLKVVK